MTRSILTQKQKSLLKLIAAKPDITDHFYLTGGTALAQYYLHHRYSEGLDFFSETDIDPLNLQIFFKSVAKDIGLKKTDFQTSFNRHLIYLHFAGGIIKTEFTYFPFTQLEKPKNVDGLKVDSLLDIAVNKTFTIYQKPRSRDFIDLYLIIQRYDMSFTSLRHQARLKFDTHIDPLQMAQQLLKANQLKDYPRLLVSVKPHEWQQFWQNQAIELKDEAIKK